MSFSPHRKPSCLLFCSLPNQSSPAQQLGVSCSHSIRNVLTPQWLVSGLGVCRKERQSFFLLHNLGGGRFEDEAVSQGDPCIKYRLPFNISP